MCGRLRVGKDFLHVLQHWSVQPCVRPFNAVHMTAGHNALRGSGPDQTDAFDNALTQVGCPDRRIDRLGITCFSPSQPSHHAGCPARSRLSRKRDGFLVSLASGHHGPDHPRNLVGERDSHNLGRPPGQQGRKPRPMFGAMDLGVADDRKRAKPQTGRADSRHLGCLYCRACSCLHWSVVSAPYRSRQTY